MKKAVLLSVCLLMAPSLFAREFSYATSAEFPVSSRIQNGFINNSNTIVGTYLDWNGVDLLYHGYIFSEGVLSLNQDYPGALSTVFIGLNNAGVAIGYAITLDPGGNTYTIHGLVKSSRGFELFDYPEARNTYFDAINGNGLIAGHFNDQFGARGYFTYNLKTRRFKEITARLNGSTSINAISERGMISGVTNNNERAFRLTASTMKLTISKTPSTAKSAFLSPRGNSNIFAGSYYNDANRNPIGYLSRNGSIINISPTSLSDPTTVTGINNKTQLSISVSTQQGNKAYQYDMATREYSLLNINPAGETYAYSINASGIIAGSLSDAMAEHQKVYIAYPR